MVARNSSTKSLYLQSIQANPVANLTAPLNVLFKEQTFADTIAAVRNWSHWHHGVLPFDEI